MLAAVPGTPAAAPVYNQAGSTATSIKVTYAAPASDGGTDINSYELQMDDGSGGDFVSLIGADSNNLKLFHVQSTGIEKGTIYRFRYRAKNQVGWGPFSAIAFITAGTVPDAPPAPVVTATTTTTASLSFSQTLDDGGAQVSQYDLYVDGGDDFTSAYTVVAGYDKTSSTYAPSVATDGLVAGKTYRFTYKATNSFGASEKSNPVIVGIGAKAVAPTLIEKNVSLSNSTSISVWWEQVTTSDLPILGYRLL